MEHKTEIRLVDLTEDLKRDDGTLPPGTDDGKVYEIVCTCEWKAPAIRHYDGNSRVYVNYGHRPTKSGKPRKALLRAARAHEEAANDAGGGKGAPMELVGRIIKTRVENEVWLASRTGDMPELNRSRRMLSNPNYAPHKPWIVLLKNTKGWRLQDGPFRDKDVAWAAARQYLEQQRIDHDIEMASSIDADTIQVPFGTIHDHFEDLVDRAKKARSTKQLLDINQELEQAEAVIELIAEARKHVMDQLTFA